MGNRAFFGGDEAISDPSDQERDASRGSAPSKGSRHRDQAKADLQSIANRLKSAEDQRRSRMARSTLDRGAPGSMGQGLNIALRMGTDFVAAVVIGAGLGWFLDRWFGTWPALFLVFFLFGAAAGFRNMLATANKVGMGTGDAPDDDTPADR